MYLRSFILELNKKPKSILSYLSVTPCVRHTGNIVEIKTSSKFILLFIDYIL